MDSVRFDQLVKSFGIPASRRSVLGILAALGLVGAAAIAEDTSAKNKRQKRKRRKKRKKKDQRQRRGKAAQEQCIALEQRCRKHGEPCCGGAKCRTLLGLPLLSGRCRCPQETRECAGACIALDACCEADGTGSCPPCDVCASGCPFTSVQAAIDAAAPGATITVCAGTHQGSVVIAKDLTISGTGDGEGAGDSILQGDGNGRVVRINDGITAELRDLRVTGGGGADGASGGAYIGGTATMTRCTVTGNAGDAGAGILVEGGSLTLVESHVTDNSAEIFGGGVYVQGEATLIDCTVSGNSANVGGGIDNTGMTELIRSTVSGNSANGGGGINNIEIDAPVPNSLILTESTVSGNMSNLFGGGIYNVGGTILFDGASRVTENTASENGGGIYKERGNVTLDSSANVSGNIPNNCAGDMIPLCSG